MTEAPIIRWAKNGDVHIAYQVVGDGPVDLLYIPGWVTHLQTLWEWGPSARFLERLASFSRLIVLDKRGMGASDRRVASLALEDQVDDVLAVLDATGSHRPVLFGANDGGAIAMLFAAAHPDRTQALAVFSTRARFAVAPDYPWGGTPEWIESMTSGTVAAWLDDFSRTEMNRLFNPAWDTDEGFRRFSTNLARYAASPGGVRDLLETYASIDLRAVLPAISAPTLVLGRADDPLNPTPHSTYIADRIPGAHYVELPGTEPFLPSGDVDCVVDEIQEFVTGSRAAPDLDRVLATVLYTDFVGSTDQSARLGDRAWRELLDRHDDIARREIERFRGRWIKHTGDGLIAAFDGPARGIKCAAEIRDAVRALGLEIRSGLHTGEVELRGDDLSGMAMNIGARVMACADGGEVLVSSTVKDLVVGSGIEFAEREARTLKGVPGEWRLYAVSST